MTAIHSHTLTTLGGFEYALIETVMTEDGPITEIVWNRDIPEPDPAELPDFTLPDNLPF
ncbi:hypothetical protein [Acidiphilium sp.]|uniref:hypothetical protein n=1 Tax=Acidiphilium sp. TaxID=527 RepID=UPI003D0171D3